LMVATLFTVTWSTEEVRIHIFFIVWSMRWSYIAWTIVARRSLSALALVATRSFRSFRKILQADSAGWLMPFASLSSPPIFVRPVRLLIGCRRRWLCHLCSMLCHLSLLLALFRHLLSQ
jgi:hypothetical protein